MNAQILPLVPFEENQSCESRYAQDEWHCKDAFCTVLYTMVAVVWLMGH